MVVHADWIAAELRSLRGAYDLDITALVPQSELATRPPDVPNSIAWTAWHLARTEDVVVNAVVRGIPQVLDEPWAARLRIDDPRIGTGFTPAEVEAIERAIDVDALDAYRTTVRDATIAWLGSDPELDLVPDLDARLASIDPIVPADGTWIIDQWRGRSARSYVTNMVVHGYVHLGEMRSVRGRLGIDGL